MRKTDKTRSLRFFKGEGIMKRKTIWYSVHNGGDGSAYPVLMESEELAELDQRHQDEGWGEPCYGSITLESESEIFVVDEAA